MKAVTFIRTSIAVAVIATLCGCADTVPKKPNVVLITIDSLRPDHMSSYGYPRQTSPFLDSLAARGCVFSNCHSVACWTAPSIASLFTSKYPRSHGVLHGYAQAREIHGQEILAPSFVTLAEVLKANGYATFGIAGTGHVTEQSGLTQGFDTFKGLWFPPCEAVHATALDLKKQLGKGKPYFLWIHYFTPHAPYYARKPWIDQYARHPDYVREFSNKPVEWLQEQLSRINESPDIRETIIDLYDAEVNFVDGFVKKLFTEVLPDGNTLTIVTADHGEMLLEHGLMGHAKSLFEEEVRIPLIIVPPGAGKFTATAVAAPVCNLDFYPTILDMVGIPIPAGLQGQSLKPLLDGNAPDSNRALFAEFDRVASPLRSITRGGWKFVGSPDDMKTGMLFDLKSDQGETNDLIAADPEEAARMAQGLQQWMDANKQFEAPKGSIHLTIEQEKILKSVGYLK